MLADRLGTHTGVGKHGSSEFSIVCMSFGRFKQMYSSTTLDGCKMDLFQW